jgi:hypothetical protein
MLFSIGCYDGSTVFIWFCILLSESLAKGFYLPKAPKALQSILFSEKKEETISMIAHLYSIHLSSRENKENQPLPGGKPFH